MKMVTKMAYLAFNVFILFVMVIVIPVAFLLWLSGYRVPVGSMGIWILFLISFIWLFWPLRALVSLNKVSLFIYFKQLFFDTKEIIIFLWDLLIGNISLLWKLIKGLIKQILKQ
ncbi:hypothetical protein L3V82_01075 [Thiotrichales bacterium 19S3-7]|nr:hypothetical protein [Thiotrichales bacterium 19S3-7]MCF6800753.1 hypothetical protein [Thiotrichales bacterium 19S3-11]